MPREKWFIVPVSLTQQRQQLKASYKHRPIRIAEALEDRNCSIDHHIAIQILTATASKMFNTDINDNNI